MNALILTKLKLSVLFIFLILISQSFNGVIGTIFAQEGGVGAGETVTTNPKIRSNSVTATVPDIHAPSAPFLISPENNALSNNPTPQFIWQQATDLVGVAFYELYLDGQLKFSNIPVQNTTTSEFVLIYDSGFGTYSLTPTQPLSNGNHTWYIKVYDASENSNTSATWNFTLDTLAPEFVITDIGSYTTHVSASQSDSVPSEAIALTDNRPIFLGFGEALSSVQVTVQIPNQASQTITFTVGSDGIWDFQLGILPRDTIITLTFVITDPAGNTSVITNLKILIEQAYIFIPPLAPATPLPSSFPTPSPEITPPEEFFPEEIAQPSPPSSPLIVIPILPPEEIAQVITQEIKELIPQPILEVSAYFPQAFVNVIQTVLDTILPVGAMLITLALPALGIIGLFAQLGQPLSFDLLIKVLQAIGLLPIGKPLGMVFDSRTNQPVAFALLTITSLDNSDGREISEIVVTDESGVYQNVQLPLGKYTIAVVHQEYSFPTIKKKPVFVDSHEFYRGEPFSISSQKQELLFLIPVDKNTETKEDFSMKKRILGSIRKIRFGKLFWPLFTFSLLVTFLYPTLVNILVCGFYCCILFRKAYASRKKPRISGFITTPEQQPIENAITRLTNSRTNELIALGLTNSHGKYQFFVAPAKYQLQINKAGLVWERTTSAMAFEEIDVSIEPTQVNATLREVGELYQELFSEQT